jgi:peptidyl-tRNA hydrolase, PTH1 family
MPWAARSGVGPDLPAEAKEAVGWKRPGRDYLLSPMRKSELTILDEVLDKVASATRRIIQDGAGPAMNEFNRKEQ